MITTRVPVHTCPCGATNDAASNSDATPTGDLSICAYCGELTFFNEDLTQRVPTDEEWAAIKANPAWAMVQDAIDMIHDRNRNAN